MIVLVQVLVVVEHQIEEALWKLRIEEVHRSNSGGDGETSDDAGQAVVEPKGT